MKDVNKSWKECLEIVEENIRSALAYRNITENSRRNVKITKINRSYIFEARGLSVEVYKLRVRNSRDLVNIRKLVYVMWKAGLRGKVFVEMGARLRLGIARDMRPVNEAGRTWYWVRIRLDRIANKMVFGTLAHELIHCLQAFFVGNDFLGIYAQVVEQTGYENPFERQAFAEEWRITDMICTLPKVDF